MKSTRVQYTVQADFGEENKRNIAAVMAELRVLNNPDMKYATYVLEDGKSFMHLVQYNSNHADDLPGSLESFKRFQLALKDHLELPPKVEHIELVDASFDHF